MRVHTFSTIIIRATIIGISFGACGPTSTPDPGPPPTRTPQPPVVEPDSITSPAPLFLQPSDTPHAPETSPTATPAPGAAVCPAPSDSTASIQPPSGEVTFSLAATMKPEISAFLNTRASAQGLEAALTQLRFTRDGSAWEALASVHETDVTGDAIAEVVVGLVLRPQEYDFTDGYLWVFTCSDGAYLSIHEEYIGSIFFSEKDGLRDVRDMNANGFAEIVFSYIDNVGAHGYFTRPFHILEWDGIQFVQRIEHTGFYDASTVVDYATAYNGDGEILDTDGDGTLELVISNGIAGHYGGPQRKRRDIFAWDGENFSLDRWEYDPPTYRFQAVQDGDDATRFGDYEQALASYQQAIFDVDLLGWRAGYFLDLAAPTPPVPDPQEWPRLQAYSRYRIILLHVIQDHLDPAQIVYDTLQNKFQPGDVGYGYAELARVFWNEFTRSNDISLACEQAQLYSENHADQILDPLGPGFYGEAGRIYTPEDICPF